jgi:AraC-like DNA-binding protein
MDYRYQKVHEPIAEYVRTVLIADDSPGPEPPGLPLFTSGQPALLCKWEKGNARIALFGQSVPDEEWEVDSQVICVAYLFKPFALATVFGIAAKDLKGKPIELCNWNPQKTIALNLQLLVADTLDKIVTILDDFIIKQIRANQKQCEIIRQATDRMMLNPGTEVLAAIIAELKLTERTLQRLFKKYVGITPNQYRRICQFYFAFSQVKGMDFERLTDVAYENGYFDQSHYIRSFKEFAGTTPNDYVQFGLVKE